MDELMLDELRVDELRWRSFVAPSRPSTHKDRFSITAWARCSMMAFESRWLFSFSNVVRFPSPPVG